MELSARTLTTQTDAENDILLATGWMCWCQILPAGIHVDVLWPIIPTQILFLTKYTPPPPPCQQYSPTAPISWHLPCSTTWVGSATFWGQVALCHAPCAVPGQFLLCDCAAGGPLGHECGLMPRGCSSHATLCLSVGINMNIKIQGFPAECFTLADGWYLFFICVHIKVFYNNILQVTHKFRLVLVVLILFCVVTDRNPHTIAGGNIVMKFCVQIMLSRD